MKKLVYGFVLCLSLTAFVSCDMNDPNADKFNDDPQAGWVRFATPGGVSNNATGCGDIMVPIILDAPVNESGVEVFYTITDVVGSTDALETYASIPAGSRQGNFVITNADALTSNVEFTLTLTSTNKGNVGVGFPDTGAQTITVKILSGTARFVGSYDVAETSSAGAFEYGSDITQGTEANELILSNMFESDEDSETSVFVNADGTLSFPPFLENPLVPGAFFEGLSGTADACTGELVINFNLRSATGTLLAGPVKVVITRQ